MVNSKWVGGPKMNISVFLRRSNFMEKSGRKFKSTSKLELPLKRDLMLKNSSKNLKIENKV
jgi:hypothetical protein